LESGPGLCTSPLANLSQTNSISLAIALGIPQSAGCSGMVS